MTSQQIATVEFADHIIEAPPEHIKAEPPACLMELLEVATEHLSDIHELGIGWKIIELEILKGKVEKERSGVAH